MLNRYISEKPKERANKSMERAKRKVGRARSKNEGKRRAWEPPPPPPPKKEGSSAAMSVAEFQSIDGGHHPLRDFDPWKKWTDKLDNFFVEKIENFM